MKDDRTEEEKREALKKAIVIVTQFGWKHVDNWVFKSPSGSWHDLSALNLNMLDYIEENKVCVV